MTLTYRSVKGSALTAAEFDGNTTELDGRLTALEDNPPEATGLSFFEVAGTQFYVHMTDSSVLGPYALPTAEWNFRGEWVAATAYAVNDVIRNDGALYRVIFAHTSDASFDAGANDGIGDDYYELLLPPNDPIFPSVEVTDSTAPFSGSLANHYLRCTGASGCTITIPKDGTYDHDIDTEGYARQCTADAPITLEAEDGTVTLNSTQNHELFTDLQGAVITWKKIGPNEWDVFGGFALLSGF